MDNVPEQKSTKNKKSVRDILSRGMYNLLRIAAWVHILCGIFKFDICRPINYHMSQIAFYKWTILPVILFVVFIYHYIRVKKFWKSAWLLIWSMIKFVIGIVCLPFQVIIRIARIIIFVLNVMSSVIKLPKRIEFVALSIFAYVAAVIIIFTYDAKPLIVGSTIALYPLVLASWFWLYMHSANPYWWFAGLKISDLFDKISALLIEAVSKSLKEANEKQMATEKLSAKKSIWQYIKGLLWIESRCLSINKRQSLKLFCGAIFIIASLTIVTFAISYYALQKVCPQNISGLRANFWEHLFFSLTTFFHYHTGQYIPIGVWAKILVAAELLSFLFLITIVVLTYTTVSSDEVANTKDAILKSVRSKKERLLQILSDNFGLNEHDILGHTEDTFKQEEARIKAEQKGK